MTQQQHSIEAIRQLFEKPFMDLLWQAQQVHREHFAPNEVQVSTLLSVKTGGCPEDCAYCPQSIHYETPVKAEPLMDVTDVLAQAQAAKDKGASRFCMGGAWRKPPKNAMPKLQKMIEGVKALGLETCGTFGTLSREQADDLQAAGLDYYNHNLDCSRAHYEKIIQTRPFDERLDTLNNVREAGLKVCCGGIMGLGETREDRVQFMAELAALPKAPESVPINRLVTVEGTPLENQTMLDDFEFVRCIAVARILFPKSHVRLSAGRESMSDATHALCYLAGANSIFYGERLLTTPNPEADRDVLMWQQLGIQAEPLAAASEKVCQPQEEASSAG